MQPLQITAYLAGSIALSRPEDLSFDGILASQMLRRHFGDEFYYLPDPKECIFFLRLPLEMRGKPSERIVNLQTGEKWIEQCAKLIDDSLWYWSCSSSQIEIKGRDTQYWNKRFDTQASLSNHINFGGKVEKILIEQGRYKAYHMPVSMLICNKIVWYAYGDAEAISELLDGVQGIGKKRSQGQGHVLKWDISTLQDDWSEWRDHRLMRPLPGPLALNINWQEPPNIQHIAFRSPQWHPVNQALCVVGGIRHA